VVSAGTFSYLTFLRHVAKLAFSQIFLADKMAVGIKTIAQKQGVFSAKGNSQNIPSFE
jgi:hypothetical protein